MADRRPLIALDDRLRDLGGALDYPAPGPLAERVAARIAAEPQTTRRWSGRYLGRPTRGLILAVGLLLLLAAAVAAVGLGLSGLRIVFSTPSPAPSGDARPSSTALPLSSLPVGLGLEVQPEAAPGLIGFDPVMPADLPAPDATFVAGQRLTLVWLPGTGLPEIVDIGAGLVLTEFQGAVDPGWYEKIVDRQRTIVEPTAVAGNRAYWITGEPHTLVYRGPDGEYLQDSRRIVGDVLIWEADGVTYRMESALGRDGAIALAETMARLP